MNGTVTCDPQFHRLLRLATLGLLAVCFVAGIASAQYYTPDQCDECSMRSGRLRCCNSPPELWVIYTRHLPRCNNLDSAFERMSFKRYDPRCGRFVQESRESFLAQEANMPTLFFSHGNTLKHKAAMKSCWELYNRMRCCPGPKRLVFWSWPAERVYKMKGLRFREMVQKNLRIKYVYAEYQGYYQAKLVQQMSLNQRVMMSGHSYGAIQSAAAAHLLGGGRLRGLTLEGGKAVERKNLRVGLISGAFDYDMCNPGHRYGQCFVAAEKVYNTRNCHDRTLLKWPQTSWRGCQAIGCIGIDARKLGQYRHKLCQQTTYPEVGTSHYLGPHLENPRFVHALCCLSFGGCSGCSSATTELVVEPDETEAPAASEQPTEVEAIDADDAAEPTAVEVKQEVRRQKPAQVKSTRTTRRSPTKHRTARGLARLHN